MDLVGDMNEKPKKKRGRPKKGSHVKDGFVEAKIKHLDNMDESLLLTDQNPSEKLLTDDKLVKGLKKRGRPRKNKIGHPKQSDKEDLSKLDVSSFVQLCQTNPLSKVEYDLYESSPNIMPLKTLEAALDMISRENVDPVPLAFSVEDTRKEEELVKTSDGAVKVSDKVSNFVFRCCSVKLKRLAEDEKQKYLNCSKNVEEPLDNAEEKDYLLENLGNFIRYKGSSTRGNFLHALDLSSSDSAKHWSLKFSDSSDEDYVPEEQVAKKKKKLPNDDLDWTPEEKCSKRKYTKNFPARSKIKRKKSNKADQVSEKLNSSSADNFSRTSADNSFTGTHSYDLNFSGKFNPLAKPEHNMKPTQNDSCSPTNLSSVSEKNLLRMPSLKPESQLKMEARPLKVTQSEVKLNYFKPQVSHTSICSSETNITIVTHIASDGNDDESMKTRTNDCPSSNLNETTDKSKYKALQITPITITQSEVKPNYFKPQISNTSICSLEKSITIIDIASDSNEDDSMQTLTNDCPSSNLSETTDMSKNKALQITPIKIEPNLPTLNAGKSQSILKIQRKRTKSQALRNSSCVSNDSEKVIHTSDRSQEVMLKKHEPYLKSERNVGKSSSSSKQQKYSMQQFYETTGNSSNQIVPIKNDSQSITESIDTISIDSRTPYNVNVQRKHLIARVSQTSNSASNALTDISDIPEGKSMQITPMKGDSNQMSWKVNKFQTMRNIQTTLQSILKKRNQPYKQVAQVCAYPSNCLTDATVSNDLQTVSMKDCKLVPAVPIEKLPNTSEVEISQVSNSALNKLAEIDNILEENRLQFALLDSKAEQTKQAATISSFKHQELNVEVSFERRSPSLISRSLQKIEHSSIPLTSDILDDYIVHCNSFALTLDDENASALLSGCNYCKNFAELDIIAILATADLDENPKACLEYQIEFTEAMFDKLKVAQPHDGEVALKLKKIALKNRGLKYGREFLSSFGSFINVSEYFLKTIDLDIACVK